MDDLMHLFLDTNSLLHYPPIKEVDWKTVCGCTSVKLIFCMQVIHELDSKKDDARLIDRANRTFKEIEESELTAGVVKEGVMLEIFHYEIRGADFPDSLSIDSKDDRIVHSVKKYLGANPGIRVAVYTEDMGMRQRCKANNAAVIKPDPKRRLENPKDELTKKYQKAISELNTLKNRLPILTIHAASTGQMPREETPFTIELVSEWTPLDIDAEMSKVRQRNPKHGVEPRVKSEIGTASFRYTTRGFR